MESKTPVTLLQEVMAKKVHSSPEYRLLVGKGPPNNPSFTVSVDALGFSAIGHGTSKKEAKHAAAEEMLRKLGENILQDKLYSEKISNPYTYDLKTNAVGRLQDFCVTYMICVPRYEEIEDEDISCTNIFNIKCIIPPFSTIGKGRNKKQAKHIAAHLMLQKLQELVSKKELHVVQPITETDGKQNKAIEMLSEYLEKVKLNSKTDIARPKVEERISALLSSGKFTHSRKWENIRTEESIEHIEKPVEYFRELMSELSLRWETTLMKTRPNVKSTVLCLQIKELAEATFIEHGTNENEALKAAVISAMKWLLIMGSN